MFPCDFQKAVITVLSLDHQNLTEHVFFELLWLGNCKQFITILHDPIKSKMPFHKENVMNISMAFSERPINQFTVKISIWHWLVGWDRGTILRIMMNISMVFSEWCRLIQQPGEPISRGYILLIHGFIHSEHHAYRCWAYNLKVHR